MSLLYSLVNVTSVSLLVGLTLFLLNVVLDKTKPKQKDLSFMKHIELANHYRNIIIALINNGYVEEVVPPRRNQLVILKSNKSMTGLDWNLVVPGPSIEFTVTKGEMFIKYTNKRTGYQRIRNLNQYIKHLNRNRAPKAYDAIQEEFWRMEYLVKGLIRDHITNNSLYVRRKQKHEALQQYLATVKQTEVT